MKKWKKKKEKIIYLDENSYRNHAGLFFSVELLKKINIIKQIHKKTAEQEKYSFCMYGCEVSKI